MIKQVIGYIKSCLVLGSVVWKVQYTPACWEIYYIQNVWLQSSKSLEPCCTTVLPTSHHINFLMSYQHVIIYFMQVLPCMFPSRVVLLVFMQFNIANPHSWYHGVKLVLNSIIMFSRERRAQCNFVFSWTQGTMYFCFLVNTGRNVICFLVNTGHTVILFSCEHRAHKCDDTV